MTHLPILQDRHNDLTLTRAITRNMPRELIHIRYQLRLLGLRRSAAYAAPKSDCLAGYLPVERAKEELRRVSGGQKVKTAPVDGGAGGREGVVGVPEEGGRVGEVAAGDVRGCFFQIEKNLCVVGV